MKVRTCTQGKVTNPGLGLLFETFAGRYNQSLTTSSSYEGQKDRCEGERKRQGRQGGGDRGGDESGVSSPRPRPGQRATRQLRGRPAGGPRGLIDGMEGP